MHETKIVKLGSVFLISGFLLLAACGPSPAPAPTHTPAPPSTATPDLCRPENLLLGVKPVNDLMLQFDDYATLAQRSDKSKLTFIIPNMQTIRRVAEDRNVPPCLLVLRRYQISYMDATLATLLEFQKPSPIPQTIATGIVNAQYFHQEYALELARVLGVTLAPATHTPTAIATP
jgi:hypothetical protein